MKKPVVPRNREGKKLDLQHVIKQRTTAAAKKTFDKAKERLFNPAIWKDICKGFSADFHLTDQNGYSKNSPVAKGDYIKINLPAPGNKTGNGYDWVIIEEKLDSIDEGAGSESAALTLRPANNPSEKKDTTAHFFKDGATSTLTVIRQGVEVKAMYNGRNEVPNNDTGSAINDIRNSLIAAAAVAGVSEAQWERLIKALLEEETP